MPRLPRLHSTLRYRGIFPSRSIRPEALDALRSRETYVTDALIVHGPRYAIVTVDAVNSLSGEVFDGRLLRHLRFLVLNIDITGWKSWWMAHDYGRSLKDLQITLIWNVPVQLFFKASK